ncbi:glutathione transferase gst 23 [Quercus suber]|uniref:Glutathione transferase gst 23 n=1 Tax=Quercus suber TaxID=58331 RepID=A0AAW0KIN6_QUESU
MVTGAVRPWSSPTSLKELHLELFACSVDKEARISDMVDIAPNGGDRSWNLLSAMSSGLGETARFYALCISHPKYLWEGEEKEKAAKEARENLKTLESGLEGKHFFGGETLGFVDIAAGPLAGLDAGLK